MFRKRRRRARVDRGAGPQDFDFATGKLGFRLNFWYGNRTARTRNWSGPELVGRLETDRRPSRDRVILVGEVASHAEAAHEHPLTVDRLVERGTPRREDDPRSGWRRCPGSWKFDCGLNESNPWTLWNEEAGKAAPVPSTVVSFRIVERARRCAVDPLGITRAGQIAEGPGGEGNALGQAGQLVAGLEFGRVVVVIDVPVLGHGLVDRVHLGIRHPIEAEHGAGVVGHREHHHVAAVERQPKAGAGPHGGGDPLVDDRGDDRTAVSVPSALSWGGDEPAVGLGLAVEQGVALRVDRAIGQAAARVALGEGVAERDEVGWALRAGGPVDVEGDPVDVDPAEREVEAGVERREAESRVLARRVVRIARLRAPAGRDKGGRIPPPRPGRACWRRQTRRRSGWSSPRSRTPSSPGKTRQSRRRACAPCRSGSRPARSPGLATAHRGRRPVRKP